MFPIHCVLESVSLPGQISDLMTPRPAPPTPNLDQLLWQAAALCSISNHGDKTEEDNHSHFASSFLAPAISNLGKKINANV